MSYWISRMLDKVSNLFYPNEITDEFWEKDEDEIY